jgi:transitional endoplasmic reticulum ATPase
VLAATNMPNALDQALRRPGRFDREILIGVPDQAGRKEILEIHTRDMPLDGVDLAALAERTHGFVGADLRALAREAGYKALRRILPGLNDTEEPLPGDFLDALSVEMVDFEAALQEMKPSSSRNFEVDLRRAGWDRIAGYGPSLEFIREMVLWPLQHVDTLAKMGISHVGGVLLTGPPAVGKTLMARSLAKESGFNVIEIRGPELISKYVGESERNVREVFRQAREMAPTVLILDGADAMTGSGFSGSDETRLVDRVVNQIAMEMSAITSEKPVLVIAICHRPERLPATLRATGKFGIELALPLPDRADRAAIFGKYLAEDGIQFYGDVEVLAEHAEGLAGGDIEEICRRAMLQAARAAVERGSGEEYELTLSVDDLLKTMDRWRLSAHVRSSQ